MNKALQSSETKAPCNSTKGWHPIFFEVWFGVLVIVGLPEISKGQFYEDFADSNFSQNPTWLGDTGKFVINQSRELQLNAPAINGSALLRTNSLAVHQGLWEFHGTMAFNPSSVNFLDLYLMATDTAPNLSGQGYLVRLGGANDNIEFHRYQNGITFKLGTWGNGWLNREINNFSIKVERFAGGIWYLYADTVTSPTGQASWTWLGAVTDNRYTQTRFIALRPVYSSTRSKLFSFRKITVSGTLLPDTLSPFILDWQFVNENKLRILFSEPIDTLDARSNMAIQHPSGLNSTGNQWQSDSVLEIQYAQPFPYEHLDPIQLSGVRDRSNLSLDTTLIVFRNQYRAGRVRISEFMSDPDPPVKPGLDGLPLSEFVEIFNPDSLPLRFNGCSLGDANILTPIPAFRLPPHTVAVLVPADQREKWQQWFELQNSTAAHYLIGVEPWPSLNNDLDLIRIVGPEGITLDSIAYQLAWWRTPQQKQGGWSMTRQNLLCPCQDSLNWMPSKHPLGGNPGEEDPLNHYTPSACRNLNPVMATQILVDPNNGLRIQFLTPVKPNQATRLVLLRNSDSIPLPLNLSDTLRLLHEWSATTGLTSSFIPGEIYTLLCEGWESCNGTKSPLQILPVGIGIQADSSQVFISEVYPRPLHTDYPWVECCNQSTKVLDRSRMWFFRTGPAGEVLEGTVLGQNLEVWFPGQCLLLSRNPNFIELESLSPCRVQYSFSIGEISSIKHSLDFSSPILNLPALPKTGAFLCIQNQFGQTLDRVAYHDSCFHPWAGNLDGRSLERWPYDKVYTGIQHPATQWMSSSTQNRASPGCFTRTLSQGSSEPSNTRNRRKFLAVALTVSNSRINPQNLDWIRIGLKFKDPNTVQQARVSIHISDMLGRIVTHLCKDEWADDKSVWSWDGRMGHGSNRPHGVIVPDGPYAVCMNWQSADSQNGWDLTEIYVWRSR